MRLHDEPQLATARERFRPLIDQLVANAQAQGTLRPDLAPSDIQVLLWELGRVVETTGTCGSQLWRRYLALALDGLRASKRLDRSRTRGRCRPSSIVRWPRPRSAADCTASGRRDGPRTASRKRSVRSASGILATQWLA
jgi:hypothetical protein